jgi:hypothetical protein
MLLFDIAITVVRARFNITLYYPDGEHPTHFYSVCSGMPVSGLRYNISCLLRVDSPVYLFVGATWSALNHRGTTTDSFLPGTTTPCPFLEPGSEVRVRQIRESSAVENASLSVLPLFASNSDLENASTPVSISVLPLDDSNLVFENASTQVSFSSPVGAVSTRPGLSLAVSRTPSANFPVWFPDRGDSSLSGFSLVLSGSDLLSERVALPLDDFGSSSSIVPALCASDSLCAVSQLQSSSAAGRDHTTCGIHTGRRDFRSTKKAAVR